MLSELELYLHSASLILIELENSGCDTNRAHAVFYPTLRQVYQDWLKLLRAFKTENVTFSIFIYTDVDYGVIGIKITLLSINVWKVIVVNHPCGSTDIF